MILSHMSEKIIGSQQETKLSEKEELWFKNKIPETKYDILTFNHFFPKLLKSYKHLDFAVIKDSFSLQINLNLNESQNIYGEIS